MTASLQVHGLCPDCNHFWGKHPGWPGRPAEQVTCAWTGMVPVSVARDEFKKCQCKRRADAGA